MGLQFLDVFKEWAKEYDAAVNGKDPQYEEVFKGYDDMLDEVVSKLTGVVMEFGVGTGNLSSRIQSSHPLIAIEPSPEMREVAERKLGRNVQDGDFLNFPTHEAVDTIVSTYAFHHLTDDEKREAIERYTIAFDTPRFVLLDTMFESSMARQQIIDWASTRGYVDLVEDLNREFYSTTGTIRSMLEANGYRVDMTQKNKFVWLVVATKQ